MSRAESAAIRDTPSNEREREVAEAALWLADRYGAAEAESQILFALGVVRRLKHERGGESDV